MSFSPLALSLFFHILATVVWIGGLLITVILVYPEIKRVLSEQPALYRLLSRLRQRFAPISNLSLAVLIATGLFQMSLDPYYEGFLTFENDWSKIMLVKHGLILVMAGLGLWIQYGVTPELERVSLLLEKEKGDIVKWRTLRAQEVRLSLVNALFGVGVLVCSAWAGAL